MVTKMLKMLMRKYSFITEEDGFSLVEMAIVLVIIGLILGGIMKGQELLESARLKSIITQANQYRLAANTFLDRYDALPGDFDRASELIDARLKDGNNNGIIEGLGLSLGKAGFDHEALSFWVHLAAAGLIPKPGTLASNTNAQFNQGAPSCKMGGGFTIMYQPHEDMPGHWFIIGRENGASGNNGLLTPQQAMSIARKINNSENNSGSVRAKDGANVPPNSCVKSSGEFNTQNKSPVCVLYIQM
jgi:prepilin-type N-terminal cleavage/methylation domain-containing protein